jgi:hypothetical protein
MQSREKGLLASRFRKRMTRQFVPRVRPLDEVPIAISSAYRMIEGRPEPGAFGMNCTSNAHRLLLLMLVTFEQASVQAYDPRSGGGNKLVLRGINGRVQNVRLL